LTPGSSGPQAGLGADERRRGARVGFDGDAIVHVRSHAFQCRTVDVAEGGIRLRGKWWARPGEYARVRFRVRERDVVALGRVAWRRPSPGGAEFGLSFMTVEASDREELQSFLDHHEPKPAIREPQTNWDDEPGTAAGQRWNNPPTQELPSEASGRIDGRPLPGAPEPSMASAHPTVLDTLPGEPMQAESSDEPEPVWPAEPPTADPPAAQPARRPRVRHRVTMHDLWMLQIREWGRAKSEDD
jgi:hypothetical protein